MKNKAIIITSYIEGDINELFNKTDFNNAFIICADGGYNIAIDMNINPDLFVGDLDSCTTKPTNIKCDIYNSVKDNTDLELSIIQAINVGYTDIEILGGIGGRLDHTIGNIQTIVNYSNKKCNIAMRDSNQEIFIVYDKILLKKEKEKKFSVLSFSETSMGVSIEGAAYKLDNVILKNTFPLGVSNEFLNEDVVVSVQNGILLVIVTSL